MSGRRVFGGAIVAPVAYGFGMIAVFAAIYKYIGVYKHFTIADEQLGRPWFTSFYVSVMAQTNAMGDAAPKTILGRSLFVAQVLLGWMWVITFAALVGSTILSG